MNGTVTITEAERERRTENRINAAVRHCRIGKVLPKRQAQPVIAPMPYVGDSPHYPPATPSIWTPNTAEPLYPIQWWQNPVCSTWTRWKSHISR